MTRRRFDTWAGTNPNAPTPCFCPSCMKAGGPARAALRKRYFSQARRWLSRNERATREGSAT